MTEELLSLKWNNHGTHFVDILAILREKELYTDATLACGGKLYSAHKFVLTTCSGYFKEMFAKTPNQHPIVFMKDVKAFDLEALLDFMYNGEVNVPQSCLGSLIKTAESLRIKGLAVPDDIVPRRSKHSSSNHLDAPPAKRQKSEQNNSSSPPRIAVNISIDQDEDHLTEVNIQSNDTRAEINQDINSQMDEPSPGTSGVKKGDPDETKIKQEPDIDNESSMLAFYKTNLGDTEDYDGHDSTDFYSAAYNDSTPLTPAKSALEDSVFAAHRSLSVTKRKSVTAVEKFLRPYACHICGKRFKLKHHVGQHMRIHTGERPFFCGRCNRSFSQLSNKISHETRCSETFPFGTHELD